MYKYISIFAGTLILISGCGRTVTNRPQDERLTSFVNPFIGTGYHGHTFPGAAYPFGQIQLSPDNGTQGWDWCSGYHYSDSILAGFSHLHLSGTGIGDLADISFLPVTSEVTFRDGEKNEEFVSRYAGKYKHSDESARPGYYSVILKDIGDFDRQRAYEAMKATSMFDRDGMGLYDKLGYMPADKVSQSVAKSEEVAIDDWSVAAVAEKLGKTEDAKYFTKRALSYKAYFDKETGFMRGKLSNGSWTTPFDPAFSNHEGSDYTEGNAWQYLWLVPQDVTGLINLLGGKEPFADKLDQLFNVEVGVKGEQASADISGLIGAYAHGNEPGHHTSFLFNFAGRAWRTQELNRRIQTEMYTNSPEGLCGNEDCGQMSAWYVFSAIGFYPVNPSDLKYQFGSPIVQEAKLEVSPGKYFTVSAPFASKTNKYIQKVSLNGNELDRTYITHKEITDGGLLEFVMGDSPAKDLFK